MKVFIKRKSYLGPFIGLFTIVSILLATISLGFAHFERIQLTNELNQQRSFIEIEMKTKNFKNSYANYTNLLFSISSNKLFTDYLKNPSSNTAFNSIENLFLAFTNHDKNIMQLRYIDKDGFEKIRFDRINLNSKIVKMPHSGLQNKSNRYYFKETIKLKRAETYTSKLDLNKEKGLIEIPPKPVLRVAIPVINHDTNIGSNNGILIVNIFMEKILDNLVNSQLFYYYIYDQDDNIVYTNNSKYTNWVKYLPNKKALFNKQKLVNSNILLNKNDKETIYLALEFKEYETFLENFGRVFIILTLLILPLSFILGFLLSKIPKTLFDNLEEQQKVMIKQSKLVAMGEMVESLAHQWRQPLNAIGILTQEIQLNHKMNTLDSKTMETLNINIQEYLENMSYTIDNFRNFFKPQYEKTTLNMLQCVNDAVNIIQPKLDENQININILYKNNTNETSPYCIDGYENEITQSILSLLKNSIEAIQKVNKKDKNIDILLQRDKYMLSLTITDNGSGIEPNLFHRIFEPYFSTKENKLQGSGLGLYIVKNIIEGSMKGRIEVKNEIEGSKFELKIPLN